MTFTFLPLFSLPYTHYSLLARCQALRRRFEEHCSWEKAAPKLKDPDRVPDASTMRRWSSGLDGSQPSASFLRQTVVRVAQWLTSRPARRSAERAVALDGSGVESALALCVCRKSPIRPPSLPGKRRGVDADWVAEAKTRCGRRSRNTAAADAAVGLSRAAQWKGRPAGRWEYVGLCPLHEESQPSFYVNTRKDVFYCHGCGQGGDLIRFVQLSRRVSFRQSLACLDQQTDQQVDSKRVARAGGSLLSAATGSLSRGDELSSPRGVHDPALIRELGIGYAAGGKLRRYLTAQGYSFDLLRRAGLINAQGADALYQRIVFPLRQGEHIVNLYGRSIGAAFAHRFLPGTQGRTVCLGEGSPLLREIILVEGLFDYAVLRQAGFSNVTCSLGTHLNADQFRQLCEGKRSVYVAFDMRSEPERPAGSEQLTDRLQARTVSAARRVVLPEGHDPNSSSLQGGDARQFQSLLEAAQP